MGNSFVVATSIANTLMTCPQSNRLRHVEWTGEGHRRIHWWCAPFEEEHTLGPDTNEPSPAVAATFKVSLHIGHGWGLSIRINHIHGSLKEIVALEEMREGEGDL